MNALHTYTYTYDGNGNVTDVVNTDGISVAHYEYDPFGRTVIKSGTFAEENRWRFSTKCMDESGLYYYGYRYYSPELGRWPSRDPIHELGSIASKDQINEHGRFACSFLHNPTLEFELSRISNLQQEVLTVVAIYERRGFSELARSTMAFAEHLLKKKQNFKKENMDAIDATLYGMVQNNAICCADRLGLGMVGCKCGVPGGTGCDGSSASACAGSTCYSGCRTFKYGCRIQWKRE